MDIYKKSYICLFSPWLLSATFAHFLINEVTPCTFIITFLLRICQYINFILCVYQTRVVYNGLFLSL